MLLVLVPLLSAALIAISRLEDYRHDVFDVLTGSALGFNIAYLTWRRHYPALSSKDCATPYSLLPEKKRAFKRLRDEEDGLGSSRGYDVGSDSE